MPILSSEQLEALFPKDERGNFSDFEFDEGIQRFIGRVVSREFRGVDVPTRQLWVWQRLREAFGEDSLEISIVFAFSPEEWEEISTDETRAAS